MPAPLPHAKRVEIVRTICEGTSLRATARLLKVYKETVQILALDVGLGCFKLHDRLVNGVAAGYLEVDEIWGFVHRKERTKPTAKIKNQDHGDAYTMFAIDNESKLVISYRTGKRSPRGALRFMTDLRKRTTGKPQMSVDGWPPWVEAVRSTFGDSGVHLGVTVKEYQKKKDTITPERRYSPSRIKSIVRTKVYGKPEEEFISTAIAERCNMTTRMSQRRLTRLTNAFSKKLKNLKAAIALHFMYYNFCRCHDAIGTAPAVQAGLIKRPWTPEELVREALDAGTAKALLFAA